MGMAIGAGNDFEVAHVVLVPIFALLVEVIGPLGSGEVFDHYVHLFFVLFGFEEIGEEFSGLFDVFLRDSSVRCGDSDSFEAVE